MIDDEWALDGLKNGNADRTIDNIDGQLASCQSKPSNKLYENEPYQPNGERPSSHSNNYESVSNSDDSSSSPHAKASDDCDDVHYADQDHNAPLHSTLQAPIGEDDLEIELALEQSYAQSDALPDELKEDMAYASLETDSDDSEGGMKRKRREKDALEALESDGYGYDYEW